MNSGLYSVLYLMYFIILDSVLYFADIECGFSHGPVRSSEINIECQGLTHYNLGNDTHMGPGYTIPHPDSLSFGRL